MTINSHGVELILDQERALFLPQHQLLAISDLHLGKSAHFRQAGLPVPATLAQHDLNRLANLLQRYQPKTLLINGDMFHHGLNGDIDVFAHWRSQFNEVDFLLVKGNHDRLSKADYAQLHVNVCPKTYQLPPFYFVHDQPEVHIPQLYPICGHIHPGVSISGKAKQRLRFPCFYFGEKYAVLPAFSTFTGLFTVYPKAGERIFAITPKQVLEV